MSFVLRYTDKDDEIREKFLGFLHCELGLSGKALVETILTEIGNLTLDINNCILTETGNLTLDINNGRGAGIR